MSSSNLVAEAVWSEIKSTRSVTDNQFSILHFLYGKNLERATKIVDQRGVTRIVGEPSGRCVFQVVGESRRKEEYFCFAEHYCACYSFFYDIVNKGEQICCKHQLAAQLAVSVGSCVEVKMKYLSPVHLFRTVMKTNELKPGRLLGLDVGHKYVGLAISDRENREALPLSVLVRKQTNVDLMAKDFRTLISELSLGGLVIGCCYTRNVSQVESFQVKDLVQDLRKREELQDVKFTYWEEHFTSKIVLNTINPLKYLHNNNKIVEYKAEAINRRRFDEKTAVDKLAAVAILQEYLDFMNRSSQLHNPSSTHDI